MHNYLHISSKQNPIIKLIMQITKNKHKHNDKQYAILEGKHLCQEWLNHKGTPEKAFFRQKNLNNDTELQQLATKLNYKTAHTLEENILKNISNVAYAQGVFFLVEIENQDLPKDINENVLVLDNVQDPGNVGTIIRSAAGAGIKNIILINNCAYPWSTKVLRSTQGSIFSLNVYINHSNQQLISRINLPFIITELNAEAINLYNFKIPNPAVWVFGNEGSGVSQQLSLHAKHRVFIPQDKSIESLNVASAAAICMFEQRRQVLYS